MRVGGLESRKTPIKSPLSSPLSSMQTPSFSSTASPYAPFSPPIGAAAADIKASYHHSDDGVGSFCSAVDVATDARIVALFAKIRARSGVEAVDRVRIHTLYT